ncbi:MAG TPA: T9SS type A sorting domain-containing protein [candidate division WOR-3 bacterium]|uniref:T9SS type A sorting domain-containing protein n=1 Tax=candidate division WOR-3 bacterium TaxID=2052148 RepID=A0A9C9JZC7_UNCW3|nr:T9SS type A sorting domain-containing protein [candidate division WOR-3 bacterium]
MRRINLRLKYGVFSFILSTLVYGQSGARYLVITPDDFYNTLQPLIEWKYKKGMKPAVYKLSQVGYDSVSIRNFIRNCYNTWEIKPEFVVLVGHPGYIPMCYYPYAGYHYYTDNYYTNMDGDLYNEIIPGRISVADTVQLKTVINKIMVYERHPFMTDPSWFKQGCAIANCDGEDDSIYLYCMRYAESLAVHNGFDNVDTLCNYYGDNAAKVINAINDGRIFVLYRGNANTHWYNPFDVNPYSTSNGLKLPIIFSITCRTVSPNSSPILGENFLRAGSPSVPKGAVGFIGGTRNTGGAAHLRNAVAIGCLDALFIEGKRTFGEITEAGRVNVYQQYSSLREYNNFTCLGDPELNIWTDVPCSLIVQHPQYVDSGYANFRVTVKEASTGLPLENAFVCICSKVDSSVYALDTTDTSGKAYFNIIPCVVDDTLFVTVTGKNLLPYEGYIIVRNLTYCFILYKRSIINDSISGNNNGIINPTENIELPVWVENISESTGVGISGVLRTQDTFVSITDSIKNFGDIGGRDSAYTGDDGYNFTVSLSCPNAHVIDFELVCEDVNDSSWTSSFSEIVRAPEFIFEGNMISGGNGNNTIEPGETVEVAVSLKNIGDAAADSVEAFLFCGDSNTTILDSMGWFGHIDIDSSVTNSTDPFIVAVDSNTPVGTVLNFTLPVFSNCHTDTFDFKLVVGMKNYYLWNPDPTPEPGENMHSILMNLGYSGDYDTIPPASLAQYQVLLVCLGVYSNRYLITDGSPEALMIIDFLNNGGRVYMEGSSVWYVDPTYFNGHDFGTAFGLDGVDWSYGNLGPIAGQIGTFTNNMYFTYGGENAYMDHIIPAGNGFAVLQDDDDYYYCGVANNAGTYRTVAASFELGLLDDGSPPSTRAALIDSIMKFLLGPYGIEEDDVYKTGNPHFLSFIPSPNPFFKTLRIDIIGNKGLLIDNYTLKIYDITGRLVKDIDLNSSLLNLIMWQGDDNYGNPVSAGVYFLKLESKGYKQVKKVILLK